MRPSRVSWRVRRRIQWTGEGASYLRPFRGHTHWRWVAALMVCHAALPAGVSWGGICHWPRTFCGPVVFLAWRRGHRRGVTISRCLSSGSEISGVVSGCLCVGGAFADVVGRPGWVSWREGVAGRGLLVHVGHQLVLSRLLNVVVVPGL